MNTEGERLKLLRQALGIRQGDFASKISTTQGHISDIENGRKNLSERTIKLISLENWDGKFVNEEWLRTGNGEMFKERLPQDEVASYVEDLLESDGNPFYEVIIGMMKAYYEMDETSRQAALEFFRRLKENLEK